MNGKSHPFPAPSILILLLILILILILILLLLLILILILILISSPRSSFLFVEDASGAEGVTDTTRNIRRS